MGSNATKVAICLLAVAAFCSIIVIINSGPNPSNVPPPVPAPTPHQPGCQPTYPPTYPPGASYPPWPPSTANPNNREDSEGNCCTKEKIFSCKNGKTLCCTNGTFSQETCICCQGETKPCDNGSGCCEKCGSDEDNSIACDKGDRCLTVTGYDCNLAAELFKDFKKTTCKDGTSYICDPKPACNSQLDNSQRFPVDLATANSRFYPTIDTDKLENKSTFIANFAKWLANGQNNLRDYMGTDDGKSDFVKPFNDVGLSEFGNICLPVEESTYSYEGVVMSNQCTPVDCLVHFGIDQNLSRLYSEEIDGKKICIAERCFDGENSYSCTFNHPTCIGCKPTTEQVGLADSPSPDPVNCPPIFPPPGGFCNTGSEKIVDLRLVCNKNVILNRPDPFTKCSCSWTSKEDCTKTKATVTKDCPFGYSLEITSPCKVGPTAGGEYSDCGTFDDNYAPCSDHRTCEPGPPSPFPGGTCGNDPNPRGDCSDNWFFINNGCVSKCNLN